MTFIMFCWKLESDYANLRQGVGFFWIVYVFVLKFNRSSLKFFITACSHSKKKKHFQIKCVVLIIHSERFLGTNHWVLTL